MPKFLLLPLISPLVEVNGAAEELFYFRLAFIVHANYFFIEYINKFSNINFMYYEYLCFTVTIENMRDYILIFYIFNCNTAQLSIFTSVLYEDHRRHGFS